MTTHHCDRCPTLEAQLAEARAEVARVTEAATVAYDTAESERKGLEAELERVKADLAVALKAADQLTSAVMARDARITEAEAERDALRAELERVKTDLAEMNEERVKAVTANFDAEAARDRAEARAARLRSLLVGVVGHAEPEPGHATLMCFGAKGECVPLCAEIRAALAQPHGIEALRAMLLDVARGVRQRPNDAPAEVVDAVLAGGGR